MKQILLLLPLVLFNGVQLEAQENNVCKTRKDYYTISNNTNCWYDYVIDADVPLIVKNSERPIEEYKVTTSDGYTLTIFRLPNKNAKHTVLLQHGILSDSKQWVALQEDSLAFQLYDKGYDVWLGNYRGNHYSETHVKFSPLNPKFWQHNIDHLGLLDLPAMIETIVKIKQGPIIYIGHSLGASMSLIYGSEFPQAASAHIKYQILVAPAYTLSNMITPLKYLAYNINLVMKYVRHLNLVVPLSYEDIIHPNLRKPCISTGKGILSCFQLTLAAVGPKTNIKPDKYTLLSNSLFTGTSVFIIRQCADFLKTFSKFDHGFDNYKIYGSPNPPAYNISNIKIPTYIMYAKNDWLTSAKDAINLHDKFPDKYRDGIYEIPDENFNHLDFLFGSTSKKYFVDYVLNLLEKIK